jgi:hypothetical protein
MGTPINAPAVAVPLPPFADPVEVSTGSPLSSTIVATGPQLLMKLIVFNSNASPRYVVLVDLASGTPTVGQNVVAAPLVPGGTSYQFTSGDLGPYGFRFRQGVFVGLSLSGATWIPANTSDLSISSCWTAGILTS